MRNHEKIWRTVHISHMYKKVETYVLWVGWVLLGDEEIHWWHDF